MMDAMDELQESVSTQEENRQFKTKKKSPTTLRKYTGQKPIDRGV